MMERLPVHIINVKSRVDRRAHITAEFEQFPEFNPIIVHAIPHEYAAVSLWLTIRKIVEIGQRNELDHIIICEDDHCFTDNYNTDNLKKAIETAQDIQADVLFGGVSWFSNAIDIDQDIFWVEKSSGLQFTVIFKRFYATLLETKFSEANAADTVISSLSDRKYFIYPFISIQKEFGYSDVTPRNNIEGRVIALFDHSIAKSNAIKMLYDAYDPNGKLATYDGSSEDIDDYSVLTTVSGDVDMHEFAAIGKELSKVNAFRLILLNRSEFDGPDKQLLYLKQAVDIAINEQEELFLFINSPIRLSGQFSTNFFYECIRQAFQNGGDMLLGGVNDFDFAVPVSNNLFWINSFISSPFIVFFRSGFEKIQKIIEVNKGMNVLDISSISVKKFIAFPFLIATNQSKTEYFSNESNYMLSHVSNKMPGERLSQLLEIVRVRSLQRKI